MSDDADSEEWRRLAAVTDAELAAGVLADVDAVLAAFDAWRAGPGWRDDDLGRRLRRVVDSVRTAVTAIPDREDLAAVTDAVIPVLGEWWPRWPPDAAATDAAVEQLRRSTMHRPAITRHARSIVATLFDRDP